MSEELGDASPGAGPAELSLDTRLGVLVDEALRLRVQARLVRPDTAPGELLDGLLDCRRRLDRVEEILQAALQLRAAAQRRAAACRHVAEDEWDAAAVRNRNAAVRDEYSSARERAAATNLEVLDVRRAERAADRDARVCDAAVDRLRLLHRGLQEVRQDLHVFVKARQFELVLDR